MTTIIYVNNRRITLVYEGCEQICQYRYLKVSNTMRKSYLFLKDKVVCYLELHKRLSALQIHRPFVNPTWALGLHLLYHCNLETLLCPAASLTLIISVSPADVITSSTFNRLSFGQGVNSGILILGRPNEPFSIINCQYTVLPDSRYSVTIF